MFFPQHAVYLSQLIMRTKAWGHDTRDRFRAEMERLIKIAADPTADNPPGPEELSYGGDPDFRAFNKCLNYNSRFASSVSPGNTANTYIAQDLLGCGLRRFLWETRRSSPPRV